MLKKIFIAIIPLMPVGLHSQISDDQVKTMKIRGFTQSDIDKINKAMLEKKGNQSEQLEEFVLKVKAIHINEDTPDDLIRKIGTPLTKLKNSGTEEFNYQLSVGNSIVVTNIQIGINGKVNCITVSKLGAAGSEQLYKKGTWETPGIVSAKTEATPVTAASSVSLIVNSATGPQGPQKGQIYFNSTDSHFYGWNGKEWRQLDK